MRDEILKTAMNLPLDDRLAIASRLMETMPDDFPGWSMDDPQFLDELDRRRDDGSGSIPWSQVQAELHGE